MIEALFKLKSAQRRLVQELGREPSEDELSEETEFPVERIKKILKITQETISTEISVGNDDSRLGDFLEDKKTATPLERVNVLNLREQIEKVLASLTDREARVIELRFGLCGGREWTLEEVGAEFQVTRERIRQIEAKAIRKLKKKSKKLISFLDRPKNVDNLSISKASVNG